jgi:GT2 family glycosyltransferase
VSPRKLHLRGEGHELKTVVDGLLNDPSLLRSSQGDRSPQTQSNCMVSNIGIVAIGRNEGERLSKCLDSAMKSASFVVYVDSGSADDSVRLAQTMGSDVVELDTRSAFTAARARNMGLERLRQLAPEFAYVQFVDGDCEIVAGWIERAVAYLDAHPDVAVACGRRRERYPDRSIYNWLCDIEWNTPIGEAKACGGDALMRIAAVEQAGRYRSELIAGEEPELCVRLRAAGWHVRRLDVDMTLHDAGMTRFDQWWRRAVRSGYASAEGAHLHGAPPERHGVWESRRAWLWGVWLPLACLACGLVLGPWGWVAWLIYPLQVLRLALRNRGTPPQRMTQALFQVLARFAEAWGQIKFMRDRLLGRRGRLIEYK